MSDKTLQEKYRSYCKTFGAINVLILCGIHKNDNIPIEESLTVENLNRLMKAKRCNYGIRLLIQGDNKILHQGIIAAFEANLHTWTQDEIIQAILDETKRSSADEDIRSILCQKLCLPKLEHVLYYEA